MTLITDHGPKISDADISELEERIDWRLPEEYRDFLLEFNGGRPEPDIADIKGLPGGCSDVQFFFGIYPSEEAYSIDWNLETLVERLDDGVLPIACDSGGSVYCLSLHAEDYGVVSYCDLQSVVADYETAPTFYPVAPNFDAFLNGLYPFVEATVH